MAKVTLEQWRMFKAVADYGGFNQAANEIHKSQSSIHHAVSKVEDQLGLDLFAAEGRRVYLTEAGQHMLRRANYLLEEANKLENLGASLSKEQEKDLKVAVDEAFPREVIFNALEGISETFPHLCIELYETVLSGANELLLSEKASLALSPKSIAGALSDELIQVSFVAVAHPLHPLHQKDKKLSFEDLKSYRQVVVRDSAHAQNSDAGWLGAERRWTVGSMSTSKELVSRGLGYAWLPQSAIENEIVSGGLKPLVLERGAQRSAHFFINYRDGDTLGPAACALIKTLKKNSL